MSYKNTLRLPETTFPQWVDQREFEREGLRSNSHLVCPEDANRPEFRLHGGPPFANGSLHVGHLLNVTLKDLVVRSKFLAGFRASQTFGWDCHGLPLEQAVVKNDPTLRQYPELLRDACFNRAMEFVKLQKEQLSTLGLCNDLSESYLTLDKNYEKMQLKVFASFQSQGLVYSALRPTLWSYGCQTALAEAEVEYQDKTDVTLYVSFPCETPSGERSTLLVWTTQPWTLLSNQAVAYNPNVEYREYHYGKDKYVMATSLAHKFPTLEAGKVFDLTDVAYVKPFGGTGKCFAADFVSDKDGTGLVHLAPAHGPDDYKVGLEHGLSLVHDVNERGEFTDKCPLEEVRGLNVFKANEFVVSNLCGRYWTYRTEQVTHRYPYCWRSKTPLLYRATQQWFVKLDDLKESAVKNAQGVKYYPEGAKNRLESALSNRPDWCVSRQRAWGLPLPVFYTPQGEAVQSVLLTEKVSEFVGKHGSQWWFENSSEQLCSLLGLPEGLTKGTDTMDVWLDSGTSCVSVQKGVPADLYLEGSDQHRGWFQSSLYVSTALYNESPFKSVLTHGFVLGKNKEKLAKSDGANALEKYVDKYGAEVLRLWVASQSPTDDVTFDETQLVQAKETLRVFRNTFKILLANFDSNELEFERKLYNLSKWDYAFYNQLVNMKTQVLTEFEQFNFPKALNLLVNFCKEDLSARYLESVKDTLYCDKHSTAVRYNLKVTLRTLATLLWPFIPFTSVQALQHGNLQLKSLGKEYRTIPNPLWDEMNKLRTEVNFQAEQLRSQGLVGKQTEVKVQVPQGVTRLDNLNDVLGVSFVSFGDILKVEKHDGVKCPRCWKFHYGKTDLCLRCENVLKEKE